MRLLELFSGIGGFSYAFNKVFKNGEVVGFSEIDKYAIQVYKEHFKGVKNYGSVKEIKPERLPDFDIVTFGFPCQDLSIAGKRKGFKGKRSSLFYEAIRIIDKKRPPYFIFENVKGLFSSNARQDFLSVLQAITDIGYDGQWQLINTKWFLPQNRERIYFVGHLRGLSRPEIFPISEANFIYEKKSQNQQNSKKGFCSKSDFNSELISTLGTGYGSFRNSGETYIKQLNSKFPNIRKLTPLECERLQGFPDGWTSSLSDSQRYKTLGNAISTKVAEEIFRRLKIHIKIMEIKRIINDKYQSR